ncbi:MAG TPA: hypothetical protein VHC69_31630 [Polyangiaceae bacterium]|nr:hypothetical protein [Polyangiaceae bacterium]
MFELFLLFAEWKIFAYAVGAYGAFVIVKWIVNTIREAIDGTIDALEATKHLRR